MKPIAHRWVYNRDTTSPATGAWSAGEPSVKAVEGAEVNGFTLELAYPAPDLSGLYALLEHWEVESGTLLMYATEDDEIAGRQIEKDTDIADLRRELKRLEPDNG